MNNEPDLDQILDSALQAYTAQEPQMGMEARVLRAARAPKAGRWAWVAIPSLAAATLALFFALQPTPKPNTPIARPSPPTAAFEVPRMEQAIRTEPRPRRLPHQPLTAPPEPPTAQQLALQAFVLKYPEQAASFVRTIPSELTIEPLAIEPLSGDKTRTKVLQTRHRAQGTGCGQSSYLTSVCDSSDFLQLFRLGADRR